ncbi:MAG TPA: alpha-L-rhamnosidase N-terminal domain-containing protein, partial [Ktedonobacteraceae bacterium]|nr:alpha-L-rhamnosidase N-terminal domain-containing protein [Ktedonobacteraceae bacterium]
MIIEQANAASPIEIRQDEPFTLSSTGRTKYHILMWVVLLLTCIGTSWFSYQYFLVPQPRDYAPDWHGAQWVQATDSTGSVAYFRYVIQLNSSPDTAFVTITANQTFLLYVNGSYIGSNTVDFVQGDAVRAYMYDVDSVLRAGPNVIAVRVMNVDQKKPTLRASLGLLWGQTVEFHGTGDRGWQATGQSALVYPRYTAKSANWVTPTFDSSTWQGAQSLTNVPGSPMLAVDPLTYEQPLPIHWIKAGASDDSYFIRQFSLSAGFTEVLLRLTATGTSDIFINGQQFAEWRGQVATAQDNVVSYLSDGTPVVQYRAGLAMGVYDVSPFLHAGTNTIAIHLSSPGLSASQVGLATSGSAMGIDMLARWGNNHATVLTTDPNWRVSSQPVAGWFQSSNPTLTWPSATLIGRPGNSRAFYLPDSNTPRNVVMLSPVLIAEVLVGSLLAVVGLWLLMSRVVVRRYYPSLIESCEAMSLAFLPALALEALLVTLAREQQIPNPFPYTWQWGLALIALVVISYIFLWVHARRTFFQRNEMIARQLAEPALLAAEAAMPISSTDEQSDLSFVQKVRQWLKNHWLLIPIILVAIPMISYNLNYEPYWQDELSSLNAAKGILAHGIPIYISGFLYPKGEGYSYLLALSMVIFGDQNGVTRLLTMLEYLISLPLFYGIGCYFFDRRISILATAMLAFSPYALLWGRQTRMYEQAFLVTLIVAYLLYYSLQHYQRARLAFLTVGCILFAYLSHEETF